MAVKPSLKTLGDIPEGVGRPGYARENLSAGILHFGVGNFHRAHQASYLDRLFSRGRGRDWAIVGASVMPGDARAREILAGQDYLSLLVEQSAEDADARITGAMIDYLPAADGEAICARMALPDIRIVSLTVTEGGYFLDADGKFDPTHDAIRKDAANPDAPSTAFGMMLKSLRMREAAGHPPFTVMCCDNIPHNGHVTRGTMMGLARLSDPAFAEWVGRAVSFPNAMVDRITPATSDRERSRARDTYGIADDWPVFSEDFIQWVLEDDFPAGRPPLEEVGVTFVEDVTPYELMKLRILNGGHAIIAYPAALLGIEFADAAMRHDLIPRYLDKIEQDEVIPGVAAVPGTDPADYFEVVRRRFANPNVADTTRRLCLDGSNRQPKFIVPSIQDAIARGASFDGLALASALWCRYCAGKLEDGRAIEPNDPSWDRLTAVAAEARSKPAAWLAMDKVYGDVGRDERLQAAFTRWLAALYEHGVEATLDAYLKA
ncbi:MAG: mannitol dehydrogenase family protein [Alphaproteobacteria bacterium]